MIVQHNHKHDEMAQVQLDEVQMSRLQMNMFSWVLVLIVQSGKVKFTRTNPYSPATPVLPSLARMLYSLPLNCKFKFVTYVDLAHAGSSAVKKKKKMDLLKIVPFSPTARSIFGPQYCQALLECCTA